MTATVMEATQDSEMVKKPLRFETTIFGLSKLMDEIGELKDIGRRLPLIPIAIWGEEIKVRLLQFAKFAEREIEAGGGDNLQRTIAYGVGTMSRMEDALEALFDNSPDLFTGTVKRVSELDPDLYESNREAIERSLATLTAVVQDEESNYDQLIEAYTAMHSLIIPIQATARTNVARREAEEVRARKQKKNREAKENISKKLSALRDIF